MRLKDIKEEHSRKRSEPTPITKGLSDFLCRITLEGEYEKLDYIPQIQMENFLLLESGVVNVLRSNVNESHARERAERASLNEMLRQKRWT